MGQGASSAEEHLRFTWDEGVSVQGQGVQGHGETQVWQGVEVGVMPFKSMAQRKFMWAKHPKIAREWTKKYGGKIVKKAKKRKN